MLAVAFQSQLGENAARLRFVALPLALLVVRGRPPLGRRAARRALRRRTTSRRSLIYVDQGRDERAHNRSFWVPAIAFLRAHRDPNFRVNALDTVGHWEAVHLPEAGFPITRGWYRQDDFPENEILYSDDLNTKTYVRWLHERGVRYVLVPRDRLDYSSKREARVATTLHFRHTTRRRLDLRGAAPAADRAGREILRLTHDQVTLRVPQRRSLRARDPRARDVRRAARGHLHARLLLVS